MLKVKVLLLLILRVNYSRVVAATEVNEDFFLMLIYCLLRIFEYLNVHSLATVAL